MNELSQKQCYDSLIEDYVDMPAEMEAFLRELDEVCQKHGFAIVLSKMDDLQVERYTEDNNFWLKLANKAY